jgi:RecB family exonuclease
LQRFHEQAALALPSEVTSSERIESTWISAGYESAEEHDEARATAITILEEAIELHQRRDPRVKTLYIEKSLSHDFGTFKLRGRVDRIDEHPDGELQIIDYKTGRESTSREALVNDIAMNCYALLLSKLHPDRPISACIHSLRSGEQTSVKIAPQALLEFESDVKYLCEQIQSRDFFLTEPVRNPLCAECDFLKLCGKFPDF